MSKMMSLLGAVKILDDKRTASRERNKMHARKTRQRKKEHMNQLETRVQTLKQRQLSLKLLIKEKNTANILLNMFSNFNDKQQSAPSSVDPKVDLLLKRSSEEIPDSTKIPDLPALILPGHHNKRRRLDSGAAVGSNVQQEYPNDGIDYELLGKDRTSCTPEELDKIRKERNRMHAKRTRDRKRIFMEEMEKIIQQLENENQLLEQHLSSITADSTSAPSSGRVTPSLNSPLQKSSNPVSKPSTGTNEIQHSGQSSTEAKVVGSQNAPQKTTIEKPLSAVLPSKLSEATNNSDKINQDKTSLRPRAVTSSEISTVSLSPKSVSPAPQHQNQVKSHDFSPVISSNELSRKSSPEPLKLPASITTTSANNTPIQC